MKYGKHSRPSPSTWASFHEATKTSLSQNHKLRPKRPIFKCPDSIVIAWTAGSLLIEFGAEHLSAFVKIITEPVEVIACWTCIRSMLESCAISAWFLDPSIDARARVGRTFAYRYEGLEQQLKFARAIGRPQAEIQGIEDRIDKVEQDALSIGYTKVINKKAERIGICQQMPSATELISSVLDEATMYRLLSAVAHGHNWAILKLGFKEPSGLVDLSGTPVKQLEKTDSVEGLALLATCAFTALARPIWYQSNYFGWDIVSIKLAFEKAANSLQLVEAARFWNK